MQPTQQTVIPVTLLTAGLVGGTPTVVDLDTQFDHVIACVTAGSPSAPAGELSIAGYLGQELFRQPYVAPGSVFTGLWIVMQSLASISVMATVSVDVTISAWRLAPSADIIFA